jgi:hypothetical protein
MAGGKTADEIGIDVQESGKALRRTEFIPLSSFDQYGRDHNGFLPAGKACPEASPSLLCDGDYVREAWSVEEWQAWHKQSPQEEFAT